MAAGDVGWGAVTEQQAVKELWQSGQPITGARVGMLTIVEVSPRAKGHRMATCACDCGNVKTIRVARLWERNDRPLGCGCLRGKWAKHNDSHARLYRIWDHMLRRCNSPTNHAYASYGGRGISVCDEWHDYLAFREWAKTSGYQENLSIDRIDNDAGYCPSNCRWATAKEQQNNRRCNVYLEHQGRRQTVTQWAEELGVSLQKARKLLQAET